jgi:ribonucleoside-diphosphate reductase alpha chain
MNILVAPIWCHVPDKPEVLNTGADDWDDVPSGLEYEKAPELSSVRITPSPASYPLKNQRPVENKKPDAGMDAMNAAAKNMQSDAPACNVCGHIMMRSGTCYKCLNCGNQGGCS